MWRLVNPFSPKTLRHVTSPLDELRIAPAQEKDLDTVLGILDEAAEWLASKGIPGWWRPGSFSREAFLDQIRLGEVYVARLDIEAVGTITLQWTDRVFWKGASPDAGYVHKLAVRRAYAGRGLGLEMLEWAARRTSLAGKKFLRLDCGADDHRIRLYYEKAGFTRRGDIQHSRWKASLYEKKL